MDTVGDAFIVTGLVDADDKNLTQQASAMVDLAREMIVALKDISMAVASGHRWWEYVDGTKIFHEASIFTADGERNSPHVKESDADLLKIRIGIDTGEVISVCCPVISSVARLLESEPLYTSMWRFVLFGNCRFRLKD